jgi:hypothetical protein
MASVPTFAPSSPRVDTTQPSHDTRIISSNAESINSRELVHRPSASQARRLRGRQNATARAVITQAYEIPTIYERRGSRESPTEFMYFMRLPIELRREIWKHALPNASVLPVKGRQITTLLLSRALRSRSVPQVGRVAFFIDQKSSRLFPRRNIGVLSACTESRNIYLSKFPLCIPIGNSGTSVLRFNDKDILYIVNIRDSVENGAASFFHLLREQNWVAQIETLGVPVQFGTKWQKRPFLLRQCNITGWHEFFKCFQNLKNLKAKLNTPSSSAAAYAVEESQWKESRDFIGVRVNQRAERIGEQEIVLPTFTAIV